MVITGGLIMDPDKYDAMLQEMTLTLREIYERESDKKLGEMEAQPLNDVLDAFFKER